MMMILPWSTTSCILNQRLVTCPTCWHSITESWTVPFLTESIDHLGTYVKINSVAMNWHSVKFIYETVTIVDNIHHAVFWLKRLRDRRSSVYRAQLCMLYLKTDRIQSPICCLEYKMDNVQNCDRPVYFIYMKLISWNKFSCKELARCEVY
jgi:hypothetical protein